MPIHLRANEGDYAEAVLVPGDPLRAKYIAETFFDDAKIGTGNTAMAAMLDGDKKLVQFIYEKKDELYNLREDIGEQHDVAAQHPDVAKRLRELMRNARTPSDDFVLPNP